MGEEYGGSGRIIVPKKVADTYRKFGELLVQKQLVDPKHVDEALALQRADMEKHRTPARIGEILVKKQVLDRGIVREILDEQKRSRGKRKILKVELREKGEIAVLGLEGRLDQKTEGSLTRMLERLMNHGKIRVAIDLAKLVSLNSHGASSFVAYVDEARARGGDIKFFNPNADSRLTLDRLDLTKYLQVFETETEAIGAFELPIDEYMSKGALGEYVASEKSRYFHLSYCGSVEKILDEHRIYYESKWHARRNGKLLCQRCRP